MSGYIISWNQVIMYKYLNIFLAVKFNLIVASFKFLFHRIRIHYFNIMINDRV